ncbi:chemerin-like receptor 2 isoform X2 [Ranitomeya variabilis]|uniref:chemerin-like receptor 2 isoform X2 n=1 Tax=Ranitomeya variabilis TaxID=490064 RepID=UPI004057472F
MTSWNPRSPEIFIKCILSIKKMENYSNLDVNITWKKYCNINCNITADSNITGIASAVICALVFLLGTTINCFVLWFKVFKMEKTYRATLSLHLFIAGFIFSLIRPLDMVYFALDIHWPFGSFICRLDGAIFYLYMFGSVFIHTLYSIDYWLVIMFPFRYISYRTVKLASKELLGIWIFSLGLCVPYFIFKDTYNCPNSTKCVYGVQHNKTIQYQSIVTIAFVLGFIVPFLVIISCVIITGFFYHRKKPSRYTTSLKLIFSLQIIYGLCWLPYHVFSFLSSFATEERISNSSIDKGLNLTMALSSLTTFINPLLYAFFSPDFQKAFSIQSMLKEKYGTQKYPAEKIMKQVNDKQAI